MNCVTCFRALVNEIVRLKMECYERMAVHAWSPEEYIKSFLEAEIKPLWPKGWMQTR